MADDNADVNNDVQDVPEIELIIKVSMNELYEWHCVALGLT